MCGGLAYLEQANQVCIGIPNVGVGQPGHSAMMVFTRTPSGQWGTYVRGTLYGPGYTEYLSSVSGGSETLTDEVHR